MTAYLWAAAVAVVVLTVAAVVAASYGEDARQDAADLAAALDREQQRRRAVEVEHAALRADHDGALAQVVGERDTTLTALDQATRRVADLEQRLAHALVNQADPPSAAGCSKARLHTREQAADYLLSLCADTNQPLDWFEIYACRICPRQPVGTDRYYHVGHHDPAEQSSGPQRGRRAAYYRRNATPGARIGDRLTPTQVEQLRARLDAGTEPQPPGRHLTRQNPTERAAPRPGPPHDTPDPAPARAPLPEGLTP